MDSSLMHYKSISYFFSVGNYTCGLISAKSEESSLKRRSGQRGLVVRHRLMCSSMESWLLRTPFLNPFLEGGGWTYEQGYCGN